MCARKVDGMAEVRQNGIGAAIESYLEEEWETVVQDIETLVSVPSTKDAVHAAEGAPFGPAIREALDAALGIAERMGLRTADDDGYLGYADLPANVTGTGRDSEDASCVSDSAPARQIGIIGHVDVVPAGDGWTVPPFSVTRREGYLLGRGVLDDKGPTVVALHAVNCLQKTGIARPYDVRVMFGVDEESGMKDVPHYLASHEPPAFLFTPDADFPVGYGEKGGYDGAVESAPIAAGDIVSIEGGMATNAVPSSAVAVVRAGLEQFDGALAVAAAAADDTPGDGEENGPQAGIRVSGAGDGLVRVEALGVGGHAAFPEGTRNAVGMLAHCLLDAGVGAPEERAFLELACRITDDFTGAGIGLAAQDEPFGSLTIIGGVVSRADGRLRLSVDCRFPTTVTPEGIEARLSSEAEAIGGRFLTNLVKPVFLVDPDSPVVRAIADVYAEVAHDSEHRPFTMGGGTYARMFPQAVSFGPNCPWEEHPDWAGEEHMADESVSEAVLKQAFEVYVRALAKLMELDF